MKKAFAVLCLLCLCVSVRANDGNITGVGGSVSALTKHPTIRMVSEKVVAKLGWKDVHVRCVFHFRNEGPATDVRIGFPESEGGADTAPITNSKFKTFCSWVDGKEVVTRLLTAEAKRPDDEVFNAWHVKDVHFAANQERTIVDEYTSEYGSDSMGWKSFEYTVLTGKSWKGKIGHAEIVVDMSEIFRYWEPLDIGEKDALKPDPDSNGRMAWTFNDYEPKRDIYIGLEPRWKTLYFGTSRSGYPLEESPQVMYGFVEDLIPSIPTHDLKGLPGWKVLRSKSGKECTVRHGQHSLVFTVGSKHAMLDHTKSVPLLTELDSADSLPVITLARAFGMSVKFDEDKGSFMVSEPPHKH
jgi:hypothetical protein